MIEPHSVWINPVDAESRQIKENDEVKVFNKRGVMKIAAKVTNRIMPGVVSIYQGAWYKPNFSGLDQGGCANVLTRGEHSPGGAFCSNTALVEVEKICEG
jgi:anaerobic dimethyl sulfoxide reductase subunit A